jgi:hypothetical protein
MSEIKLEIKVSERWLEVSYWIFRSWTGERRRNGVRYYGERYNLGSEELISENQVTAD